MPLRIIEVGERIKREDEQRRRKAGRRKSSGTQTARKPSKPPRPSAGPGSLMSKPTKQKVMISEGPSFNKNSGLTKQGERRVKSRMTGGDYRNILFPNVYLTGGQAKLDKNKNNKIDAQDFKILRAEKAKGRGQGLQDEKMKPGKVMKARVGKSIDKKQFMKTLGVFPTINKASSVSEFQKRRKEVSGKGKMTFSDKMKAQELGLINKKTGAGSKDLMKRAASVTLGKKLLVPVALGIGAVQYLKGKMKDKKDKPKKKMGGGMMKRPMYNKGGGADMSKEPTSKVKASETVRTYALAKSMKDKDRLTERDIATAKKAVSKKMGGGMMQRPMGMARYKKGTMIKARGGGMARTKPTKMY